MHTTTTSPKISIIIPSWTGDVSRLTKNIEQQTLRDYEIIVVRKVSPAARARNLGAQQATTNILLFLDDDAYLGHESVLETMVEVLENEQVAIVGASQQMPVQASAFQHAVARQVPRYVSPIVLDNVVSNPPLNGYGFTAITTLCCAVRRSVFEEVRGFDEELPTGEDTDFFYRVRRRNYNLVVAANCWVYHEPPASLQSLLRKNFWYGVGHVLEARLRPERGMMLLPLNRWYGPLGLAAFLLGFPLAFFVHYYFSPKQRLVFGFRPLKTLASYAVLCGYVYGWYHNRSREAEAGDEDIRNGGKKLVPLENTIPSPIEVKAQEPQLEFQL